MPATRNTRASRVGSSAPPGVSRPGSSTRRSSRRRSGLPRDRFDPTGPANVLSQPTMTNDSAAASAILDMANQPAAATANPPFVPVEQDIEQQWADARGSAAAAAAATTTTADDDDDSDPLDPLPPKTNVRGKKKTPAKRKAAPVPTNDDNDDDDAGGFGEFGYESEGFEITERGIVLHVMNKVCSAFPTTAPPLSLRYTISSADPPSLADFMTTLAEKGDSAIAQVPSFVWKAQGFQDTPRLTGASDLVYYVRIANPRAASMKCSYMTNQPTDILSEYSLIEPNGKSIHVGIALPHTDTTTRPAAAAAAVATTSAVPPTETTTTVEPLAIFIKNGIVQTEEKKDNVQFNVLGRGYHICVVTDEEEINDLSSLSTFNTTLHTIVEREARLDTNSLSIPPMSDRFELPMAFAWHADDKPECVPILQVRCAAR